MKKLNGYCARKSSALALCRLIVTCYFTVFAVIPLTHIHVEEGSAQMFSSLWESKSKNESFLLILHEILFLHFKDRADHTLSSRSILTENTGDANSVNTKSVPGTGSASNPSGTGPSPYHFSGNGLKFMVQRGDAKAVDGFLLFPSGLSPPAP